MKTKYSPTTLTINLRDSEITFYVYDGLPQIEIEMETGGLYGSFLDSKEISKKELKNYIEMLQKIYKETK